ncbi:hypothetical protein [Acinetobacter sp. ANC 4648]|uniref:hypothetical protein n=1 Tax=Acinetobacter sp. ANC 4648 TaxID=1977875 RepID=UPI000A34DBD9|nr:hypothetical protein [Acinetobacter sp. ANC 4648]OTG85174.1 hypothetical protein B9T27_02920 [Acinetobacter sp. ANC 4648]
MESNEITFFLPKKTMNEATIYYVDIVKQGFIKAGYTVKQTETLAELKGQKKIFVMSAKWCFIVKLLHPQAKIVTWFQGLGAEEALMTRNSLLRKKLWNCVEFFSMKFSWFNIYVSERMHQYYNETYHIEDKNFFIMPCFNKALNIESFDSINKYENSSFVYAGGLDKWQCIEETLELYSLIEKKLSNTKLTLLTKDKDSAERLIKKYNIKNYEINFVSLDELDAELMKYKYGFLIRQNHIVNNVSTPTKMNSYLANGVIPIYTDVIDDFNIKISKLKSCIKLNNNDSVFEWANLIFDYDENMALCKDEIKIDIGNIFSDYYLREVYINDLSEFLISI